MSQPSSLVQLRPHGFDPQTGYTIGPAPDGTDKTPFPQTQEYRKCAICQDMALAGETGDGANFAVLAALVVDGPSKCEFVQNTLFVF